MDSEDYEAYLFPDEKNRSFWMQLYDWLTSSYKLQMYTGFFLAIIGIPSNIFHLVVLSRRAMMTSSTNIILLGIAICDIIILLNILDVSSFMVIIWIMPEVDFECDPPISYFRMLSNSLVGLVSTLTRRSSIWLGVSLSVIRTVVIKYPLHRVRSKLSVPLFGWISNVVVLILCSPLSIFFYLQYVIKPYKTWVAPEKCGFPTNYTQIQYYEAKNGWFAEPSVVDFQQFLDGLLTEFIPCLILPIATVLLILEVRKRNRRSIVIGSNTSRRNERSTKLVLFMTISFLFSIGPLGLASLTESFVSGTPGFSKMIGCVCSLFRLIMSFNAVIHCFICFFMSSQYRKTTRELFSRKNLNARGQSPAVHSTTEKRK